MDKIQNMQEQEYDFPYHYIPEINKDFKPYRSWNYAMYYSSSTELIKDKLVKLNVQEVLDVGCGDGRLLNYLAKEKSFKSLSGFDYSEHAIKLAQIFNPKVNFFVHDIYSEDYLDCKTVQAFTLIEVLEHIPIEKVESFISGLSRIMSSDTYLFLTVPHNNNPTAEKHYQHFDYKQLSKLFNSDFEEIEHTFLHKKSLFESFLKKLMINKFFILTARPLRQWIYKTYKRKFLEVADEKQCQRNFMIFRKK
ncbi:MAG: hypothetical protein COA58_01635 [Bacteroidetes bacterium]|nr:MAG: hypothetical protein COA58_01635 [Bacteroidota bacterium]